MNRTGLFIALGLFGRARACCSGSFPNSTSISPGCSSIPRPSRFPLKFDPWASFFRDAAMWIAWGIALRLHRRAAWSSWCGPTSRCWCPAAPMAFLLITMLLAAGILTNLTFKSHWGRPRPIVVTEFSGTHTFRAVVGPARLLPDELLVLLRRRRHRVLDLCARRPDAAAMAAVWPMRPPPCSAS